MLERRIYCLLYETKGCTCLKYVPVENNPITSFAHSESYMQV